VNDRREDGPAGLHDPGLTIGSGRGVGHRARFLILTGRRGYLQAGLGGMASGAVVGFLVGWLLGVFTPVEPLVSAIMFGLWGVVIGEVIDANVGQVAHALTAGRRDFSSSRTLRAQRYDLVADAEVAVKAGRSLTDARVVSPGAG
jgi:hypothetical protein